MDKPPTDPDKPKPSRFESGAKALNGLALIIICVALIVSAIKSL